MSKKKSGDAPKAPTSLLKSTLLLLFCIGGIYSAYLTQGYCIISLIALLGQF